MARSKDPRFEIRKVDPAIGEGLFALVPIKKGDFILEYTGKKIPTPVADTMSSRFLFEINGRWTIEGSTKANTARYINHHCDPNVEANIVKGRINIYAIRDIAAGEELGIDYGEEYFDEFIKPHGCKCGAAAHLYSK
jgi:SET domain-containing protein